MIRTLITAVIIGSIATHFGVPTTSALGNTIATALILWYLWPALRHLPRTITRIIRALRGRRTARRRQSRAPAPGKTPSTSAQLTQINHHHHYCDHHDPQHPAPRPAPNLLGLPQRGDQQIAHDTIYDVIEHP